MSKKLTILLTVLLVAFVGLGISSIRTTDRKLQLKDIKLQDNNIQINKLLLEKKQLNEEFEKEVQNGATDKQRLQELEKRNLELEEQVKDLQAAKEAKQRNIASVGLPGQGTASAAPTAGNNIVGSKADWLRQSGIPESDWWAVDSIVSRESSWRPNAVNASSGACGLAQALPCSKLPCSLNDPVCHLKWQHQYVTARYGGYPQAVAFWNANHWY